MVRVDSVRPFMVLVIFLICLHFNTGPHETLSFKMEILWLDNCPNKLNFFNIWISTIEVFQQVLLTVERCVPP